MVLIVASGDQHVGAKHLTTLADQDRALRELVAAAAEANVLLLAGDATHTARPEPQVLALWGEALRALEESDVDVVAIAGNHDGPAVTNVFEQFRGRIHIATTPRVVPLRELDVACLPWLPDAYARAAEAGARSREEIAAFLTRAARDILRGLAAQRHAGVPLVLLTHATIAGAETSGGFDMGSIPSSGYILPLEELADFDFVFAGHIHRHQQLQPGVVYTGSLLPLDFSETEPKGFVRAELTPVFNKWQHVPVTSPRVATWEWDDAKVRQQCSMPAVFNGPPIDLLRVRISCTEATARECPAAAVSAQLYRAGARLVQVEYDIAREDRRRDAGMTADLDVARAIERYLEAEIPDADRQRVLEERAMAALRELEAERAVGAGDLAITRLEAQNFLGLEQADLWLNQDIAVLTGQVGAGKSSLGCDVVRFALFGTSRAGERRVERLVRSGSSTAAAAVELLGADGTRYRVVRKLKVDAHGRATSTLDVLERELNAVWRPVATGRVADGEAAIARILGGLSDETLVAANLVVQRAADAFTRARAEDRRKLLAEAAGLSVFDSLASLAQQQRAAAEREVEKLQARAEPLRARTDAIPRLQEELEGERRAAEEARGRVQQLETAHGELADVLERARVRAASYDVVLREARALQEQVDAVGLELRAWGQKKTAANAVLVRRTDLARAREELARLRASIEATEEQERQDQAEVRARDLERVAATERRLQRERALATRRHERERELERASTNLRATRKQLDDLRASGCLEACEHRESCSVRSTAAAAGQRLKDLEEEVLLLTAKPLGEQELERQILGTRIPEALTPNAEYATALRISRRRAAELEDVTELADAIAKAEQSLAEHDEAVALLEERRTALQREMGQKNAQLLASGSPADDRDRAAAALDRCQEELRDARAREAEVAQRAAMLSGRITAYREDAEALAWAEEQIAAAARDVADLGELVKAWRAVRVMVLETSVIPSVEQTANEILERFPYGIRIALRTQRERKSGDGMAEALDVEVQGGLAPQYELLSGGQRTCVDLALHIAIALVVSRRASTRLSYMFIDEPEGLDESGRVAFAGVVRWIHDAFSLAVLVASHHGDLVAAIGAREIVIEGTPGRARVGEPEAVPA